ncbi:MAG: stage II sporulation protein M [Lachnospiraceae bacterium]|nr:stage II sporulation protein M [Lachnospiraceae bacterium]
MKGLPTHLMQKVKLSKIERLPIAALFMAGLFAGIIMVRLGKDFLPNNTRILDENTLYDMKYMTVDSGVLFYYCLKQRLGTALCIAILSTTYLGLVVCGGIALWYGVCGGVLLSVAVTRYSLKGILLLSVGLLPQFLIYIPAFVLLLRWGERVFQWIYVQKRIKNEARENFLLPRCILQLLGILALFLLGCVLESYVNPYFLQGLLKIF